MKTAQRLEILEEISDERDRQERLKIQGKFAKTCADDMSNADRYTVLGEEFGEVGHELNEAIGGHRRLDTSKLRAELRQVAAVCLAWIEGLQNDEERERREWANAHPDIT